ncbi:hypothetical protein PR202_gb17730 [Eleusine coracana subsp. coracana]|uniref:Uncharacterized protein n=1 Tax=Eleusine coracana subsp. coracana TaxID=191504 RepID=A0AAV5F1G3_ELECO|nr:hypothetical protein PR202_gb17730 [Eleusine coracana subsp. coracana]
MRSVSFLLAAVADSSPAVNGNDRRDQLWAVKGRDWAVLKMLVRPQKAMIPAILQPNHPRARRLAEPISPFPPLLLPRPPRRNPLPAESQPPSRRRRRDPKHLLNHAAELGTRPSPQSSPPASTPPMAALLRARPNHNPLLPRPFSSSSSTSPPSPFPSPASTTADPSSPSHFADIRNCLGSTPVSASSSSPRRAAPSLVHDIRHTLKTFRSSNPTTNSSSTTPSFLDILANTKHSSAPAPPSSSSPFSFGALRDSLRKPGSAVPGAKTLDWNSLLSKPQRPPRAAVLGRDPKEKVEAKSGIEFQRHYSYDELGKRLHALRPAGAGKDGKEWFSLEELTARLGRLREMDREEKERKVRDEFKMSENDCGSARVQGRSCPATSTEDINSQHWKERTLGLRLFRLKSLQWEESEKQYNIVECSDLLKINWEREEDKHSRKGLQEMVQRRKKYLKYLLRTDWDSYCLVLSKLGLRDVPEFKPPDYKSKSSSKTKSKKKSKRKMKA